MTDRDAYDRLGSAIAAVRAVEANAALADEVVDRLEAAFVTRYGFFSQHRLLFGRGDRPRSDTGLPGHRLSRLAR